MFIFWLLVAAAGALYLAMMVLTVPVLLREAGGLKPFDFRPFGYSFHDVQTYLGAISEEGLATYLGLQHSLTWCFRWPSRRCSSSGSGGSWARSRGW
jgi:hypothetical protein